MNAFKKLNRFALFLFSISLFSSLGGQYALVQSFAWAKMFLDNAHSSPVLSSQVIARAAKQTLDGKHPCSICKKIESESAKSKSKTKELSSKRSDYPKPQMAGWVIWFSSKGKSRRLASVDCNAIFRQPPPTEPPRMRVI